MQRESLLQRLWQLGSGLLRVSLTPSWSLEGADMTDANLFKEAFESAQEKNAGPGGSGGADVDSGDEEEDKEEETKAEVAPVAVS
jgi:hypothetical protein